MDHQKKQSQKGASLVTMGVFVGLLAVVVYVLSRVLPIYYSYYEFENELRSLIDVGSELDDSEIMQRVTKKMKSLNIPAEQKDVRLRRRGRKLSIDLAYTEYFDVELGSLYYELWTFDFYVHVEGEVE